MKNQLKLCSLAYLLLFLDLDFNLNNFTIAFLPDFLGWFLLFKVIKTLKVAKETLGLLRVPCVFLMITSFGQFFPNLLLNLPNIELIISLGVTLFSLYFHFQFITDIGEILKKYNLNCEFLYKCRNILTISVSLTQLIRFNQNIWIFIPVLMVGLVAGLTTSYGFNKLSKELMEVK